MPKTKKTSKRKPNPAFMRPVQPDDKLAAVVGSQPLSRPELTKKLWAYIKRRGLQDKKKRIMINADDQLKPVFNGKSQVSMFEMTKLVSKHLRYTRIPLIARRCRARLFRAWKKIIAAPGGAPYRSCARLQSHRRCLSENPSIISLRSRSLRFVCVICTSGICLAE